jgi:pilus assembly protein CpaE
MVNRIKAAWRSWRGSDDGLAAVEFAIFAPVLILMVLTALDMGFAVYQRMTMDHVLRSGAQFAMVDPEGGAAAVQQVLQSTATKNFSPSEVAPAGSPNTEDTIQTGQPAKLRLTAERYCACPEAISTAVNCASVCTGTQPTYIYYRLGATKGFKGMLLPSVPLSTRAEVQVR